MENTKGIPLFEMKTVEEKMLYRMPKTITSVHDILACMFHIQSLIRFDNPLTNEVLSRMDIGPRGKNTEIYRSTVDSFKCRYYVEEPTRIKQLVLDCISALSFLKDKIEEKGSLDEDKEYIFTAVKGSLGKFYQQINPYTNTIEINSTDSTELVKMFTAIETNLTELKAIDIQLNPDVEKDVYLLFQKMHSKDQITFMTTNWQGELIAQCDDETQILTLNYLLANPKIKIDSMQLIQLYNRFEDAKKIQFIKAFAAILTMQEQAAFLNTLNIKVKD